MKVGAEYFIYDKEKQRFTIRPFQPSSQRQIWLYGRLVENISFTHSFSIIGKHKTVTFHHQHTSMKDGVWRLEYEGIGYGFVGCIYKEGLIWKFTFPLDIDDISWISKTG